MMEHGGHHAGHAPTGHDEHGGDGKRATVVLHVGGLSFASEVLVVERALRRRPGVLEVEANPVSQTATVTYDAEKTTVAELRNWVQECGYHCAGQSVPTHVCDPMQEPDPDGHAGHGAAAVMEAPSEHEGHVMEAPPEHMAHGATAADAPAEGHAGTAMPMEHEGHAMPAEEGERLPHEVMGHGGHAGMSMEAMVRDMRNRFVVAAVLSIPILLWSRIGRDVLNFSVAAPFGLSDNWFQLLLSLPVIFYSGWIFFDGAFRALRARTLDMMVLVAVAIGAGWLYSVVATLAGGE